MVSVAHAADSSSASVNPYFTIRTTERASAGILKIHLTEGPSFFVRELYLEALLPDGAQQALDSGAAHSEESAAPILHAARIYSAECAAMALLGRAEQSSGGLRSKLLKKGFSPEEIKPALTYLSERGYLDDRRFTRSWLNGRTTHQAEGRVKLLAGLLSRGVPPQTARMELDTRLTIADEEQSCERSARKLMNSGREGDKLRLSLVRKGFSLSLIEKVLRKLLSGEKNS